ncbi:MAG TPA: alanine--tRNA ligase-related protein [Rhabdochlamydiaceae bacterium]
MTDPGKKCVRPLYMEQSHLLKHKAKVIKISSGEVNKKRYKWVLLDETIFHPKGGGQPSDQGTINGVQVVHVAKELLDKDRIDFFEILHCFDEHQELSFKEGDEVELIVDGLKRNLFSRMHTAGHLIAEITHELFSEFEAFHGNHEPENGYVRFKIHNKEVGNPEEIRQKIQHALTFKLQEDTPVYINKLSSGIRSIKIKQIMPCGGTHVDSLKEIGQVEITGISINKKEGILTVKYRLTAM